MESSDNIFGKFETWIDSKFPELQDRPSKSQSQASLNIPLRGMKPSTAFRRIVRFARPTFTITMVLSMISLGASEHVQHILFASFSNLMSLTLIKLFCYIIIILLGLHLALNQMRAMSTVIKQTTSFVCEAGFDCTSSTIGVVAGTWLATCVIKGFLVGIASVASAVCLVLLMNLVFWFAINFQSTWDKLGVSTLTPQHKVIAGCLLTLVGLLYLHGEPWKELVSSASVCPPSKPVPACVSFCLNVKT